MKLDKLPRGKVTVGKLLRSDTLYEMLADLEKLHAEGAITNLVMVFENKDGDLTLWANQATHERINWLLDWGKRQVFEGA